jgi:hypothetical protein
LNGSEWRIAIGDLKNDQSLIASRYSLP